MRRCVILLIFITSLVIDLLRNEPHSRTVNEMPYISLLTVLFNAAFECIISEFINHRQFGNAFDNVKTTWTLNMKAFLNFRIKTATPIVRSLLPSDLIKNVLRNFDILSRGQRFSGPTTSVCLLHCNAWSQMDCMISWINTTGKWYSVSVNTIERFMFPGISIFSLALIVWLRHFN